LLIGGFIELKRGFVILPRLRLDPFWKRLLADSAADKNAAKRNRIVRLAVTFLIRSYSSRLFLSPSFFREK